MKVIPTASCRALSSTWRALRSLASRAPRGSSSSSTDGLRTSARASATRCCWPPDSWAGRAPLQALELHQGQGLGDPPPGLALVDVLEAQPEGDVVGHAQEREQRVALEHGVDLALVRRGPDHVDPVEQDAPVGGLLEPGDQAQGGRLAV